MAILTFGNQTSASRALRALSSAAGQASGAAERLATGLRINRAADDAASLSVASSLQVGSRILNQGVRNINDGISLLSIAEGALGQLQEITERQSELAGQAASEGVSLAQRRALQTEADQLVAEFNRIVETTSFNDVALLRRNDDGIRIQLGTGIEGSVLVELTEQLSRAMGTFTLALSQTTASFIGDDLIRGADLNRDGYDDLVDGNGAVRFGSASGAIPSTTNVFAGGIFEIGDVNNDGYLDHVSIGGGTRVRLGNGDGTFSVVATQTLGAFVNSLRLIDVDDDGNLDFVSATSDYLYTARGGGDGTFDTAVSIPVGPSFWITNGLDEGDFNGDGLKDLIVSSASSAGSTVFFGTGGGSFAAGVTRVTTGVGESSVSAGDVNRDGYDDFVVGSGGFSFRVMAGSASGTFAELTSFTMSGGGFVYARDTRIVDFDGDGFLDILATAYNGQLALLRGNGDGTFGRTNASTGLSYNGTLAILDQNGDGAKDVVVYDAIDGVLELAHQGRAETTTAQALYLLTPDGARVTLDLLSRQRERIALERGTLGASLSRLSSSMALASRLREAYAAAEATLTSADVASDAATLVASRIRQQVGTAVLAQANAQDALLIDLLRSS